jgi:hypothetical protein
VRRCPFFKPNFWSFIFCACLFLHICLKTNIFIWIKRVFVQRLVRANTFEFVRPACGIGIQIFCYSGFFGLSAFRIPAVW